MSTLLDASEFEPYLTPDETGVPASVIAVLDAETAQGVPTGVARHPTGASH